MVGSEGSTWASSEDWASATFGDAGAPSGGGASEGSPDWWNYELAARASDAAANTESTPSQDTGGSNTATYTDPRTGQQYPSYEWFLTQNPTGVSVPEWSTPGIPVKTPSGEIFYSHFSQYDMDPAYDVARYGQPSLAEQKAYSDAGYARDFAGALMEQYGQTAAPVVQQKAAVYKSPSTPAAVPRTIQQQIADLTGGNEQIAQGMDWIKNNLLIVVIIIAAVFVLPRFIPTSSRGR